MYTVRRLKQFEKSFKKLRRSGLSNSLAVEVAETIDILTSGKKLPVSYRDHELKGEYEDYRECHIRGDLLLLYKIEDDILVLVLADIGSHSYLFG